MGSTSSHHAMHESISCHTLNLKKKKMSFRIQLLNKLNNEAENFVEETTGRNQSGRYVLRFSFIEHFQLGEI